MRGLVTRSLTIGFAIPLGLAILGVTPCFAQIGSGQPSEISRSQRKAAAITKPVDPPPPVLPGTKAPAEAAAPTKSLADMSPTEGLFDAVNRGDLATARDAVNRGARLDEHNVLGLTPLELSIDLGRNDISFYLLSIRGDDPSSRQSGDRRAVAPRVEPRARLATVSPRARDMPADLPVESVPRFSSGNGGAPIPDAGFLGFGGGRAGR